MRAQKRPHTKTLGWLHGKIISRSLPMVATICEKPTKRKAHIIKTIKTRKARQMARRAGKKSSLKDPHKTSPPL